jgi:RimJ/RimL family protein N-acetyltransferase
MEVFMVFSFHPMDEDIARAILNWRYDAPYDLYNPDPDNVDEDVQIFLDPQNSYYSITNEREDIIAYCCFGPEAQVQGEDYSAEALDIGMGIHPDMTGQGHGLKYIEAIIDFGFRMFSPNTVRVTVAEFNRRALRVCEKAGFQVTQTFRREQDSRPFIVLTREI